MCTISIFGPGRNHEGYAYVIQDKGLGRGIDSAGEGDAGLLTTTETTRISNGCLQC